MRVVTTVNDLRAALALWRRAGQRIGLCPTMGNLHAGHMTLVDELRASCDRVVASVFVNPMQFGPKEDFHAYPRTLDEDRAKLEARGVDVLFAPAVGEVYPRGMSNTTRVEVPGLSDVFCGASRPGHFNGVATVVSKLFNMVQADAAIFGEKDYQQFLVIRRLVEDLDFPVQVLAAPTVREDDGLAMSSRNGYLSAAERLRAPLLYKVLSETAQTIRAGSRDWAVLEVKAREELRQGGLWPDYLVIRRARDLGEIEAGTGELRILAAVMLGQTRLIDNIGVEIELDENL